MWRGGVGADGSDVCFVLFSSLFCCRDFVVLSCKTKTENGVHSKAIFASHSWCTFFLFFPPRQVRLYRGHGRASVDACTVRTRESPPTWRRQAEVGNDDPDVVGPGL